MTRLEPTAAYTATSDGALLVDIRPEFQRRRDGEVPGAIIVERNHLEWRLHPGSSGRIPEAMGFDVHWIVLCDEGLPVDRSGDISAPRLAPGQRWVGGT